MSHVCMSHVTHMNESCHTYAWVTSHVCMSHVTHMHESRHTYAWVMSHIWMSHTHSTSRAYESVMSYTWMCHRDAFCTWHSECDIQSVTFWKWHSEAIRQGMLEMSVNISSILRNVNGAKGSLFQILSDKSRNCFRHSPRPHIGYVWWNSKKESRRQFSQVLWVCVFGLQEMRFRKESAKTYHPKHPPEGSFFWPEGWNSECDILNVSVSLNGSQSHSEWDILDITETHSESEIRNGTVSHSEFYCVTFWMFLCHSESAPHWRLRRCTVLQCVAVWCSVVQCGAVWCSVLQCVAVESAPQWRLRCCTVLQCGAVWYSVFPCVAVESAPPWHPAPEAPTVLQCVAVCCGSVLQCVAVCCSTCHWSFGMRL